MDRNKIFKIISLAVILIPSVLFFGLLIYFFIRNLIIFNKIYSPIVLTIVAYWGTFWLISMYFGVKALRKGYKDKKTIIPVCLLFSFHVMNGLCYFPHFGAKYGFIDRKDGIYFLALFLSVVTGIWVYCKLVKFFKN